MVISKNVIIVYALQQTRTILYAHIMRKLLFFALFVLQIGF